MNVFFLPGKVCPYRVTEVKDAGGRELELKYNARTVGDLLGGAQELVPTGGLAQPILDAGVELPGTESGRLQSVTDHAGRVTEFDYDGAYLASATVAKGTDPTEQHKFGFKYESGAGIKLLTEVTDPREKATKIEYGGVAGPLGLLLDGRKVSAVTDRREAATGGSGTKTRYQVDEATGKSTVTDTRNNATQYDLDGRGRMTAMVDPRNSRTELTWDDLSTNDNNVAQHPASPTIRLTGWRSAARQRTPTRSSPWGLPMTAAAT